MTVISRKARTLDLFICSKKRNDSIWKLLIIMTYMNYFCNIIISVILYNHF